MTNDNRREFLKNQRDLKDRYLGGTRDNRMPAASDPAYNSPSDTDISPGAAGRTIDKE